MQIGSTALHDAVSLGHSDTAELLLKAHCDVDKQNNSEWTALHVATSNNNLELVKLLLAHGAKKNIVDQVRPTNDELVLTLVGHAYNFPFLAVFRTVIQDNNRPVELIRSPSQILLLLKDTHADLLKATKDGNCDQLKELFRFNTIENVNYRDEVLHCCVFMISTSSYNSSN